LESNGSGTVGAIDAIFACASDMSVAATQHRMAGVGVEVKGGGGEGGVSTYMYGTMLYVKVLISAEITLVVAAEDVKCPSVGIIQC
jgi:hypothetical protein